MYSELQKPPKKLFNKVYTPVVIDIVADVVNEALHIPFDLVKSPSKRAEVVDARTIFITLCLAYGVSVTAIASHLDKSKSAIVQHLARFNQLTTEKDRFFTRKVDQTLITQKNKITPMTRDEIARIIEPTIRGLQDQINHFLSQSTLVENKQSTNEKEIPKESLNMGDAVEAWKASKDQFKGKNLDDFQKSHEPQNPTTKLGGKAI